MERLLSEGHPDLLGASITTAPSHGYRTSQPIGEKNNLFKRLYIEVGEEKDNGQLQRKIIMAQVGVSIFSTLYFCFVSLL